MNINSDITFNSTFYATDPEMPHAYPMIAIRPHIIITNTGEKKVHWDNFGRGMDLKLTKVTYVKNQDQQVVDSSHPPKEIILTHENGKVFILRMLTCEVANNMPNIRKKHASDAELQEFTLNYDPDAERYGV